MGLELRRAIAGCHARAVRLTTVKGPRRKKGCRTRASLPKRATMASTAPDEW
jgi:hypothetical protein